MELKAKKICDVCNQEVGLFAALYPIAENQYICRECVKKYGGMFYLCKMVGGDTRKWTIENIKNPEQALADRRKILEDKLKAQAEIFNTEIINKCNVCGNVFCYSGQDLSKNAQHARSALLSSIGGLCGAVSGNLTFSAVSSNNADNNLNRVVDYSKCPKCNSKDLQVISKEEFQKIQSEQLQSSSNTTTLSSADELLKFKDLLDNGTITQEEFETKKRELLNL